MDKTLLRAQARATRNIHHPDAAEDLARLALDSVPFRGVVAGVWPLPGEMDPRPLLLALHARGHRIVLPHTPPLGERLAFRGWEPGCPMVRERFGTFRPDGALCEPDSILVPLLAFDRSGHRLGYGGGYYDRTLAALPDRLAVGFGFAAQEVARVPVEPHDRRLAMIVTEREVIRAADYASR